MSRNYISNNIYKLAKGTYALLECIQRNVMFIYKSRDGKEESFRRTYIEEMMEYP